jgi:pyruvate,water dikinase
MKLIKNLEQLNDKDYMLAGGKAASLGKMIQMNTPVPSGFVIFSAVFDKLLNENGLNYKIQSILDLTNHKEIHTIENASEKIKSLIFEVKIPKYIVGEIQEFFKKLDTKYVAVRSSATAEDSINAAWPGQLESYLNTTENNLLENIKKCWASLFTLRAIFYRFEKGLRKQKISVAVIVQKMVESEISGVAFSVHPVTRNKNQLIIEAGFGLGEAIVSGKLTPDSYTVEKNKWEIIDKKTGNQKEKITKGETGKNELRKISEKIEKGQVINDEEIINLAKLIVKIEKLFGFPVDIEFAKKGSSFYILQSRPITTLN